MEPFLFAQTPCEGQRRELRPLVSGGELRRAVETIGCGKDIPFVIIVYGSGEERHQLIVRLPISEPCIGGRIERGGHAFPLIDIRPLDALRSGDGLRGRLSQSAGNEVLPEFLVNDQKVVPIQIKEIGMGDGPVRTCCLRVDSA